METIAHTLMSEHEKEKFDKIKEVDFGFGVNGVGRFRVNIYQQRGTIAVAIRAISMDIKSIDELKLPELLKKIAVKPRGLIIVTGTVGSGKSTTIAAMLEHINREIRSNIITIEDPIEFLFKDKKSIVHQREVGTDTESYAGSLKYLLRQDPDVIMIGEIRDAESMYTALRAANTGHLVFTTLHTTDAMQTVGRILSFFPGDTQNEIRGLLAVTMEAVISQRLIPTKDGKGRVAATEVLTNNEFVKECLENPEKTKDIRMALEKGDTIYGMHSFDKSIYQLYSNGLISYEEALENCTTPADFERKTKGLIDGGDHQYELGDYDFTSDDHNN
jgi:twitching motility protein PilT